MFSCFEHTSYVIKAFLFAILVGQMNFQTRDLIMKPV